MCVSFLYLKDDRALSEAEYNNVKTYYCPGPHKKTPGPLRHNLVRNATNSALSLITVWLSSSTLFAVAFLL